MLGEVPVGPRRRLCVRAGRLGPPRRALGHVARRHAASPAASSTVVAGTSASSSRKGFPVFSRFVTPEDSTWRWKLEATKVTVMIGRVRIEPGDWGCRRRRRRRHRAAGNRRERARRGREEGGDRERDSRSRARRHAAALLRPTSSTERKKEGSSPRSRGRACRSARRTRAGRAPPRPRPAAVPNERLPRRSSSIRSSPSKSRGLPSCAPWSDCCRK